ncbi:hypothetical protein Pan44_43880 [Caulifigura coniformis]|uniref:Uncharacterized protein n=1 Tax=Caulifigura coniformis TaxID=2527983 RepID=A0A517SJP3_9PLAN|nr:hypothetical protein [Caulifigura coniformis]QDT56335.1 hypothetical protein Pan44_43880 [Caulifigura coniformis]
MTPPARTRRWRLLGWTAALSLGVCVIYVLVAMAASPFAESRLLAGKHPDLVIGREWDPRHGRILTIRDDLPSDCDCPLHQMLSGRETVSVGMSTFFAHAGKDMALGGAKQNKFEGRDIAPARLLILSRRSDTTIELHLMEDWSPSWTLRQVQGRLVRLLRNVYR